jgi:hypothetical protein
MRTQINFNDAQTIGRLQIDGTLAGRRVNDESRPDMQIGTVVQDFDYVNNSAYQFGGQSLGAAMLSLYRLSPRVTVRTRLGLSGLLLGAVNSEYTVVIVGSDERDYDFGPGAVARVRGVLDVNGLDVVDLSYDLYYIHTLTETDSDHLIHDIAARFQAPLWQHFGIGVEGRMYGRNSHYDLYPNVHRWVPQARAYLSYDLNSLSADIKNLTAGLAPKH